MIVFHKLVNGIPCTKEEEEFITRFNNNPYIKHWDFPTECRYDKTNKTKCTCGHCF